MLEVATKAELSMEESLAAHAAVIRALGKRVIGDVIEIGRRLTECKRIAGRGNWLPWLEREFGWGESTAKRFVAVHEAVLKSPKLGDLELPVSSLYLLAAPSTPEEARDEIIERASNGETLSLKDVKKMIEESRVAEAKSTELKLTELTAEFAAKEQEIRQQYEDRLTIEEVEEKLDKALEPLQKKIDKYELELKKRKPGPEDAAQEKADKAHAEKLHRQALVKHFNDAMQCLDYKPGSAAGYVKSLQKGIAEAGASNTEFINEAAILRAWEFLTIIKDKWSDK